MEARPWANGVTVTYRYHPLGEKPISLGTDREVAIRRVASMSCGAGTVGTIDALWKIYKESSDWAGLSERTQSDYEQYASPLLRVFGETLAAEITAPMVARYLRVERKTAPVRANREVSLLGNLIALAIDRGEAEVNPCRGGQVRRNKERPRSVAPETDQLNALINFAESKGGQWSIVIKAAEYAALAGSRKIEFLRLHWPQVGEHDVRLMRGKQRSGAAKIEKVRISPALRHLLERLRPLARDDRLGAVFPNRQGNPYTSDGFSSMWQKLIVEALAKGVITTRFTFHDLRAYYVTQHKERRGALPDLHASPTTTARVYERSRVSKRDAL
jgi:integrase